MPQYLHPILVFIPCRLEPDVRFSLIRLSDSLLPVAFTVSTTVILLASHIWSTLVVSTVWLTRIAYADVLVSFLRWSCPVGRACTSLTVSLGLTKVETLPSHRVLWSRWSTVLWPPPTSHPASAEISSFDLCSLLRLLWATDRMRPLLFHRLLSPHPMLPTPEGS